MWRQERRQWSQPESESWYPQGRGSLALGRKASGVRNDVRTPRTSPTSEEGNTKLAEEHQRAARANARALWNEETKLQLWNNNRNKLSYAIWTALFEKRVGSFQKVGWHGHTTRVRRFRHFHWMQRLAQKERRTNVATQLLLGASSLTMAVCVCKGRRSTGME